MLNLKKIDYIAVVDNSTFEGSATGSVSSTVLDYCSNEVSLSSDLSIKSAKNCIFDGVGTSLISSTVLDV